MIPPNLRHIVVCCMIDLKPTTTNILHPCCLKAMAMELNDTEKMKMLVMELYDTASVSRPAIAFVLLYFEFVPGRWLHHKVATVSAGQQYIWQICRIHHQYYFYFFAPLHQVYQLLRIWLKCCRFLIFSVYDSEEHERHLLSLIVLK